MSSAVQSGQLLAGRYRLIERLGRGGFGEVWRADDPMLAREVALKTISFAPSDDVGVRRFRREARALARLNHPNVVAVFDTGLDDYTGYLVMQLLSGPSLATLLARDGPLPVDQALEYARQAAAGLAAAHDAGLVHRDVSPSNLILDGGQTVKLVDFGVARVADASMPLTMTGTVFATPGYVSPEQAAGRPADPRSDLYALGCVLYALLAGGPPFTAEHPIGVVHQHLTSPPPELGALRADIPVALDALLAALLAKDPADRPARADEVAARLDAIRPRGDETTVPLTAPTAALTRRRRRLPWLGAAGLLAVLAGGVALALALIENDRPTTPTTTRAAAPPQTPTTTAAVPTTTAAAATPPPAAADPYAAALAAITQAQASGRLDPKAAADLERQLATRNVEAVRDKLDHLARKGQVSGAAYDQISAALDQLPSQPAGADHSPEKPKAKHARDDESDD